jgi:hypothetical protein
MIISPLGAIVMPSLHISPQQFGLAVSSYAFSAGVSGFLAVGFGRTEVELSGDFALIWLSKRGSVPWHRSLGASDQMGYCRRCINYETSLFVGWLNSVWNITYYRAETMVLHP